MAIDYPSNPARLLDTRSRLAALAGRLCPLCSVPRPLLFDGRRLRCLAEHGWSNADSAEADILLKRPQSMAEQQRLLAAKREAEYAEAQALLIRLEWALGDYLPPEARRE